MSRCFSYPPPGYCRNGATYESLIESIKLQKETNKTKAERKKEKKAKKEKKEIRQKEKRNNEYQLKLQKEADYTEPIKKTKTITEIFEKSDLTEEHGPSIRLHQPSYSSDSTQNSNKRKRDDSSLSHDRYITHGNGKSIKIRFLKKHKDSDPGSFCADAISNRIQSKSNPISEKSNINESTGLYFGNMQSSVTSSVKPIDSFRLKKSDVEAHRSIQPPQQPILRFERQVSSPICFEPELPSSSVSTHVDEHRMHNSVSNVTSTSEKRSDHEATRVEKQKEDTHKVGPTRHEKKIMKKHTKYEKLVGSLFPLVFEAPLSDDDGDWLLRGKTLNSPNLKGEVETCWQLVSPWQPCARYLADVDMHALPYTVPF